MPLKHDVSSSLKQNLSCMKQDNISLIVQNDKQILKVGENVLSASNSARKGERARQKIRSLGKTLEKARQINPNIKEASDLVKPESFDTVVHCARALSGYNNDSEAHHAFSSALRVGHATLDLAIGCKVFLRPQSTTRQGSRSR
ncbi:hypothetical protein HOLleu_01515 [Holothuria leucospilota]|uniref:Uncharacterized protein n=1 Tax=Holothuria leucospilota TaxID=206669 RepID=A0A9Q1CP47_HOLLE|nr:hypothetical protein HOLleu_01515 [Holothuria leucospilota]